MLVWSLALTSLSTELFILLTFCETNLALPNVVVTSVSLPLSSFFVSVTASFSFNVILELFFTSIFVLDLKWLISMAAAIPVCSEFLPTLETFLSDTSVSLYPIALTFKLVVSIVELSITTFVSSLTVLFKRTRLYADTLFLSSEPPLSLSLSLLSVEVVSVFPSEPSSVLSLSEPDSLPESSFVVSEPLPALS